MVNGKRIGDYLQLTDAEAFALIKCYFKNENALFSSTFIKAGIKTIGFFVGADEITINEEYRWPDILKLYLNNQYERINSLLDSLDISAKIYYQSLISPTREAIDELLNDEERLIGYDSIIPVVFHKMRKRLLRLSVFNRETELRQELSNILSSLPPKYKKAMTNLNEIASSKSEDHETMANLLVEHEENCGYSSNIEATNYNNRIIEELKSYAYDYFFFIKCNYLPLDRFADSRNYLKYYIKAILCSYFPKSNNGDAIRTYLDFPNNERVPYTINDVDLDIIVKYSKPDNLKKWFKEYHVQKILFSSNINLWEKIEGLISGFYRFRNKTWIQFLDNLLLLSIKSDEYKPISGQVLHLLFSVNKRLFDEGKIDMRLYELSNAAYLETGVFDNQEINEYVTALSFAVLSGPRITNYREALIKRVLKKVSTCIGGDVVCNLEKDVLQVPDNELRRKLAFTFRHQLNSSFNKSFWEKEKTNEKNYYRLLFLVIEQIIDYSEEIEETLVEIIRERALNKEANSNVITFPDVLEDAINCYISFIIAGFPLNLEKIADYSKYSKCLEFMFNPKEFDYSNVNTNEYMWGNLIRSPEYGHWFTENTETIVDDDIKYAMKNQLLSEDQCYLLYGFLLSKDSIKDILG